MSEIMTGRAPGGERRKLIDLLPMSGPMVMEFSPVYACNFKCKYCMFGTEPDKRAFVSEDKIFSYDLFKKTIVDSMAFPVRPRVIRFAGMGEPLMHPDIAKMVRLANALGAGDRTEIITNASLLDGELADSLDDAGLDRLVVSIQGMSTEKYKDISGTNNPTILEDIVQNVSYMHKYSNVHVYVKIIDIDLTEAEERMFYEAFDGNCSSMGIEHASPIYPGVDYDTALAGQDKKMTQFYGDLKPVHVCPQPFYNIRINTDGSVIPCYSMDYPLSIGNVKEESIVDIWNGGARKQFINRMAYHGKNLCSTCNKCRIIDYRVSELDRLDDYQDKLKKMFDI